MGRGGEATWRRFLVLDGLGVVAALTLPGLAGMVSGVAVAGGAIAAVLVGSRRWAGPHRRPWVLIAVACGLFVSGHVTRAVHGALTGVTEPVPSPADAVFLVAYALVAVALVDLLRRRDPGASAAVVAETLVVAVAIAVLSWSHLLGPSLTRGDLAAGELAALWIRPVADVVLVSLGARIAVAGGLRSPAWRLAGLALLGLVVGDTVWAASWLRGAATPDAVYLAWSLSAYVFAGAAALHPSMGDLAARLTTGSPRLSRTRLVVLGIVALAVPLSTAAVLWDVDPVVRRPPLLGTAGLFVLVLWRLELLVRTLDRAAARQRLLREAGAVLVGAGDADAIASLAARATFELVDHGPHRVTVAMTRPEGLVVMAAVGTGAERAVGTVIDVDLLRPGTVAALLRGHHVTDLLPSSINLDADTDPAASRSVLIVPLHDGTTLRGILTVATPVPLDESTTDAVTDYAPEVALAFQRCALTDEVAQQRSERRFAALVARASDVVLIVDADGDDGVVRYASPSWEALTGRAAVAAAGGRLSDVVGPDDVAALLLPGARGSLRTLQLPTSDGGVRDVEARVDDLSDDDDVAGFVVTLRDVTDRVGLERQLRHRAFHDDLTGVANRALFLDRLSHELDRREQASCAVLFCDLDDFKAVNDGLGHAAGDAVLVETARRLEACVRAQDTVGRVGGDEFAVVVADCDAAAAERLATRIAAAVSTPQWIGDREVVMSASIGVAVSDDRDADALLRDADTAMYDAKRAGRDRVAVFDPSGETTADRLALAHGLRTALRDGGIVCHYQPVVDLADRSVVALEALVRWEHPVHGLLAPGAFLGVAERSGQILTLGRAVLQTACEDAAEWRRSDGTPVDVHVNVSPFQLRDDTLVADVLEALASSGLAPERLALELTEEALIDTRPEVLERLTLLRQRGIRVIVDDFGTGYSSLGYLQQLPIDGVKIDRSFVSALHDGDRSLLTATLELLAALDHPAVLEGIETPEQLDAAQAAGCRFGQGFLLGRPADAATTASRLVPERA